ncbi:hypothetical protein HRG_013625 [Hirsutella rhossiliensis]
MDAVAAFLAADLKERIFMKVPTELQQYFGKYVQILKRDWFLTDDSGPDNIQTYRVGEIVAEFLYDDSMKHATPMEPGAIRKFVEEPDGL